MEREINRAKLKEKRAQRDDQEELIWALVRGDPSASLETDYMAIMVNWIEEIRTRYAGMVIRRTLQSVDNEGKRISGLEPYNDIILLLNLYPSEMKNLEDIAGDLVEETKKSGGQWSGGQVSIQNRAFHQTDDKVCIPAEFLYTCPASTSPS